MPDSEPVTIAIRASGMARLAVWLLSDEASYVSVSTYLIDGALNA